MKILVPTSSYPRHDDDAAGRFVRDLSLELQALGHEVLHVAPQDETGGPPDDPMVRRFSYARDPRQQTLAYGAGIGANLQVAPWRSLRVLSFLRSFRKCILSVSAEFQPDVILSHWLVPAALALAIPHRSKTPHLVIEHGGGLHLLRRLPGGRKLLDWILSGSDGLVFVAEYLRKMAKDLSHEVKIEDALVQAMGARSDVFQPALDFVPSPAGQIRLISIGRLIPFKGYDLLARALAGLEGITWTICGAGPYEADLRRLTSQSVATFAGHLGPQELADHLRAADLLVVSSRQTSGGRTEGAPTVISEAFLSGVPVLASAAGGVLDLVQHGVNGWLCKPNSVDDLRRHLIAIRDDADQRFLIRQKILASRRHYDIKVSAEHIEKRLLALVAGYSPGRESRSS